MRENGPKTADQLGLLERLGKIADHAQGEHSFPDVVIRIGGDKDRGNRMARIDQMLVKANAGYFRHVNIGHQATGDGELRGREEFGGRCERRHAVVE